MQRRWYHPRSVKPGPFLAKGAAALLVFASFLPSALAAAPDKACVSSLDQAIRKKTAELRAEYVRADRAGYRLNDEKKRLSILRQIDQGSRSTEMEFLQRCHADFADPVFLAAIKFSASQDKQNQQELHSILKRIGWPVRSKYGDESDQTAFLIVQHADNDPAWQAAVLPKLKALLSRHETSGENYALLYDRVQTGQGRPQRYGSQGSCVGPVWQPQKIENPGEVDKRRAEVGLPPMKQYVSSISRLYCKAEK